MLQGFLIETDSVCMSAWRRPGASVRTRLGPGHGHQGRGWGRSGEVVCAPSPGPGWPLSTGHIWRVRRPGSWNWEVSCDQTGTSTGGGPRCPRVLPLTFCHQLIMLSDSQEVSTTAVICDSFLYCININKDSSAPRDHSAAAFNYTFHLFKLGSLPPPS